MKEFFYSQLYAIWTNEIQKHPDNMNTKGCDTSEATWK